MNVERFNSIMNDIIVDYEELNLASFLQNFQKTFTQNINQPNPNTAEAFSRTRKELWDALAKCRSNDFPPSQKAFIDSIAATGFVGNGLRTELERIMTENIMTPGQAVSEVQAHMQKSIEFMNHVKTINSTLLELKIEYDFTDKDEYEVGVLFPVALFKNNLEGLQKELCKLNQYMKVFGEIAADDTASPTIRTISSDSAAIFLAALGPVAMFLATAIEKIVGVYAHVLQIRKLRQEMKETKVPDDLLKPIETHEKQFVTQELEIISKELFKEFRKKTSKERDSELQSHLTKALLYIMKRLDQGVDFEVTPPSQFEEPKEDAGEKEKKEYERQIVDAKKLSDRSAKIRELPAREQPLLFLPEPDEDEEPKEPSDKTAC